MYGVEAIARIQIGDTITDLYNYKHPTFVGHVKDQWNVTPRYLFTKESRRLNQELGLNRVNMKGNVNNFKK